MCIRDRNDVNQPPSPGREGGCICALLVARIEVVAARRGLRCHVGTRTVRTAAAAREALAALAAFGTTAIAGFIGATVDLRLRATGDERGQAIDAAGIG